MQIRLEQIRPFRRGLQVQVECRYRQASWLKTLWVPWKWLATDEIADAIMLERDHQHRPLEDQVRPWLPLEVWE